MAEKQQKKLRFWNGRTQGNNFPKGCSLNVAAFTKKQACELIGKAADLSGPISGIELNNYYSECWGNDMKGLEATTTEPCVYLTSIYGRLSKDNQYPKRLL